MLGGDGCWLQPSARSRWFSLEKERYFSFHVGLPLVHCDVPDLSLNDCLSNLASGGCETAKKRVADDVIAARLALPLRREPIDASVGISCEPML
jgi:hypothetical protein